ncbi:MAG: hypothetical protein ACOYM9_14560 [Bradymonadia bacterium]
MARLAAAVRESDLDDAPAPKPSLMAGLPRPRVSSAPSPLTATGVSNKAAPIRVGGVSAPSAAAAPVAQAAVSTSAAAARRTVMGMPLLGPGAMSAGARASDAPQALAAEGTVPHAGLPPTARSRGAVEVAGGASLESLGGSGDGPMLTSLDDFGEALNRSSSAQAQAPHAEPVPQAEPAQVEPRVSVTRSRASALDEVETPIEPPVAAPARLPTRLDTEPTPGLTAPTRGPSTRTLWVIAALLAVVFAVVGVVAWLRGA